MVVATPSTSTSTTCKTTIKPRISTSTSTTIGTRISMVTIGQHFLGSFDLFKIAVATSMLNTAAAGLWYSFYVIMCNIPYHNITRNSIWSNHITYSIVLYKSCVIFRLQKVSNIYLKISCVIIQHIHVKYSIIVIMCNIHGSYSKNWKCANECSIYSISKQRAAELKNLKICSK